MTSVHSRLNFPPNSLILALDVGSSSVRAMIFDVDGVALDDVFVQQKYSLETTSDGGSTIPANSLWELLSFCINGALEQAGERASRIAAVATDTLVSNLLGVDAQGRPTTPIFTWADVRGGELAGPWRAKLESAGYSAAQYTQRTGCRIHTSYWPLRLVWLRQSDPALFERTAYWLTLGEWMLLRLFGERRVSASAASWTGLLNRHTLDWDATVLATLPIRRDQLGAISGEPLQGLFGGWADRWPALREAYWFPAVGDGAASNLGAGCTDPARIALSVGTSAALRIVVPGAPANVPDGLFAYRVDERRSLVGGALSNAGNLYAWLQRTLKLDSVDDLELQIGAIPPDAHGLTVLPFLAGERAPGWNPHAQAVILGMTQNTTPPEIVRAGLEAVAYRMAQIARRLAPLMASDAAFVASGAAILHSPAWMQIIADVLGRPVYATTETETTIRGALALATGREALPHLGPRYDPNPTASAIYDEAIARQRELYTKLFENDE